MSGKVKILTEDKKDYSSITEKKTSQDPTKLLGRAMISSSRLSLIILIPLSAVLRDSKKNIKANNRHVKN